MRKVTRSMKKKMESHIKDLEHVMSEDFWVCPRCHKKGIYSIHGSVCTKCANELRLPDNIKQAIKDGWLLPNALNIH